MISDAVALEIVRGVVSVASAVISGIVAVFIVKIRRDVKKATKALVETIPAQVTTEAKAIREALAQNAAASARLASDGSPDDVARGAVHTHQRKAQPEV